MKLSRFFKIRREKGKLDFKRKILSKNGLVSWILWILSVAFFVISLIISVKADGNGGQQIGILGFCTFFLSLFGLGFAFAGMNERDVSFKLPVAGGTLNAAMLVFLLILYLIGLL